MKSKLILATAIVGVGLALPSGSSAAPFAYVTNFFGESTTLYQNLGGELGTSIGIGRLRCERLGQHLLAARSGLRAD